MPTNPGAIDGLTSDPFDVTEVVVDAPGGMDGVEGANVLASAPDNDTPVAAAWNASDLAATGRLVVVMDVNWLDPSRKGPQAEALVQNLALFLSGLSSPPGDPVESSRALEGSEPQAPTEPATTSGESS